MLTGIPERLVLPGNLETLKLRGGRDTSDMSRAPSEVPYAITLWSMRLITIKLRNCSTNNISETVFAILTIF